MHDVNSMLTTYKQTLIITHNAARVEGTDRCWFFDVNDNTNWNSHINTYRGHPQGINNLIQVKIQITPAWKCQPLMLASGPQSWSFYRCLATRQRGEVWGLELRVQLWGRHMADIVKVHLMVEFQAIKAERLQLWEGNTGGWVGYK